MSSDDAIWFIVRGSQGNQEEGPYTPTQLERMERSREINGSQELRRKGDTKRSTVDQALALKRQIHKNNFVPTTPSSSMHSVMRSTAMRAFLLFILLLAVAAAALYYSGQYKQEPWLGYLRALGINL